MATPSVSVLLPVRDQVATLGAALDSLARQTLIDHEVVAVDDGSVDGSEELLDRRAADDPRLVVVHLARCGLVAALNAGLGLCRAPLVARMDGDDICHPRRLELQHELLLRRPEVDVVSCRVSCFPRTAVGPGLRLYEAWLNALSDHRSIVRERFVEAPLVHPSTVIRRRALDEVGGWRDLPWPEDHDLWLRLAEAGARFAKVDRPLFFWRHHPDRLTLRHRRYHKHRFLELKARFLASGPLAHRPPVVLWGAGPTGRRLSRLLRKEGVTIAAVVEIDPTRVGSTLHGAPIIASNDLESALTADTVVLVAVASRGARDQIRPQLDAIGLVEGRRYWCVA